MDTLSDILKITLPALIVFFTAWVLLRNLIKNDQDKRRQELILQNSRTVTAKQLHSALLNAIRSEFEHNLSQQIYMSQQAWEVVRNARSNMIKIINSEAEKMPPDSSGMALGKQLLEKIMELEKEPTRAAIEYVKNEIARII